MLEMAEARKVFLAGVGPGGREETVALVASDLAIESCTGNSFASPCAVAVGSSGALGSGRVTSLASINQSGGDKGKRARAPRSDGSLIVIGRGTGTQAGDAALHKLAAGIARRSIFVDGRAAVLRGRSSLAAAVQSATAGPIHLLPFLMGVGLFAGEGQHGTRDMARALSKALCPAHYCGAIGGERPAGPGPEAPAAGAPA
jgi:hypothetical protein